MSAMAPDERPQATPSVHRFERRAMGSPVRLTVSGATAAAAETAWDAASAEIEKVEQACSRFRPSADLVRLNASAGDPSGVRVDRRLVRALVAADRAHRVTGGRFDARVLIALERLGDVALPADPGDGAPDRAGSGPVRPTVSGARGWRASGLRIDPRADCVAAEQPVDLGGIGKGLALRWAMRAAVEALGRGRRPTPALGLLLEAGGDLVVRGAPPDGASWMIGIEDPAGGSEPVAVVAVDEGAVCTSSVRIRSWHDPGGRPVHHLIDPSTGEPGGEGLLSVTIAGEDPAWAEVLCKALFLAGARGIGELARPLDLAAWWVEAGGELGMTPRARLMTAWTR
jgi:thiamine biosynthesis lipoprotein